MGSASGGQKSDFAADAAASADDEHDAAAEFLLRRLAAKLGFFHGPVLDAEGFDGRQGDVVAADFEAGRVHAFAALWGRAYPVSPSDEQSRAFDDVNGVGVELADDARFSLVFAEAEHAEARNEDDGWIGIAQRGRVGRGELVIVGAVLLTILGERGCQFAISDQQLKRLRPMGQRAGESWCG